MEIPYFIQFYSNWWAMKIEKSNKIFLSHSFLHTNLSSIETSIYLMFETETEERLRKSQKFIAFQNINKIGFHRSECCCYTQIYVAKINMHTISFCYARKSIQQRRAEEKKKKSERSEQVPIKHGNWIYRKQMSILVIKQCNKFLNGWKIDPTFYFLVNVTNGISWEVPIFAWIFTRNQFSFCAHLTIQFEWAIFYSLWNQSNLIRLIYFPT